MANLLFKGERLISSWSSEYFSGTFNSPAAGEEGDLLIFIYMNNNSSGISLSPEWTWVDSPANKKSVTSVSFAYKQLTASDLSANISILGGRGAASLVHLGPCTIVRKGVYTAGNHITLNEPGENFVLQSNPGDGNDGWLTSHGFTYLPPSVKHYSTGGYNVLWKAFTDSITYTVNTKSNGTEVYNNNGWGERPSYMIIRLGPVPKIDIEVSTSDDGITFSSYVAFNPLVLPQKRYLKFRATVSGGVQDGKISTFEFDQTKPETKLTLNEFLESAGANVKLKTLYPQEMVKDDTYVDGKLFTASINRSQFKKVTKLEVR